MVGKREWWLLGGVILLAGCGLVTPAPLMLALIASLLVACSGLEGVNADNKDEKCCNVDGKTTTCQCPANTVCNYGLGVTFCGNGTCFRGDAGTCPETPDAATLDAGRLEGCCVDGKTSLCYCPGTLVCNYGMNFNFCADGTCSPKVDGGMCPADAGT